ncbi:MAG: type II secretion system protein [Nitrospirota bacterium]|jgi:general secretion pathway protein I
MRPRSSRGFTLLEVMIALAIVGGLLVTLLYTLGYHLDVAARQEAATVATMLAKNKLTDFKEDPTEESGSFPEPFEDFRFRVQRLASPYPGVLRVKVTVTGRGEEVSLSEFMLAETTGAG